MNKVQGKSLNTFIVTSDPEEVFNVYGKSLGMREKRALFYAPISGRSRVYRQSLAYPSDGLKLLTYKSEKGAQKTCNFMKSIDGGNWKVENINKQ